MDKSESNRGLTATHLAKISIERTGSEAALRDSERRARELLQALPNAVYMTDADGRITFYNQAAVDLWGHRPELGKGEWCGSWRLYWPDGRPMPHEDCPMAVALKDGRPIQSAEAVAERPDGTRVPFLAFPTPLRDASGALVGAVNTLVDITERNAAEVALRESEERLAAIFNQATAGFAQTDLDGRFTLVNDRYCAIVGRAREELLRLRMQDITHPEDLPRNLPLFMRAVETGEPFVIEKRYVRPDETVVWVNNSVTTVRDRHGSIQTVLAVSIDVTERKEAEQLALQFASMVESSDDAIVSKDTKGIIATWNRGAERLFGYAAEEVIGKPITILIPPDRQDEEPAILARILRGERIDHFETVRRRKDGSAVEISLSVSPVRDRQGKIVGAAKIARDITGRKRTEESLRDSAERFRALVEASAQIVWTTDAAGAVVEDSPSWRAFTGQSFEQWQGFGWLDALHPEDRKRVSRAWRNVVGGQRGIEIDYRLRHSGGEWRWMTVRAAPVFAEGGALKGYVGMNIDITERKEAEERQRLLARELDHRAKNLLTVVLSILQLSQGDDVAAFVAAVKGRISALARALGLLSQSRWEGADLGRLVEDELAPYRTGKGRIAASGPPLALRPAAAQSMALALHELATNAAKHGALSGAAGRLAVTWQATDEDGLTLSWTETGGPAVAAPPTRRGFGSTVIGASVEQQLGGTATFDWRPEGLRAMLTVPRAQLAAIPSSRPAGDRRKLAAATAAPAAAAALAGRRVLLVEDEALIAMDIESALSEQGCTIVGPASSLAEALAFVGRETFDAAIVDRNLGGASSQPVAAALRARGIPFVIVTGYADAGLPLGFGDVPLLAKPFNPADLTALVARHLAGLPRPGSPPHPEPVEGAGGG